MSYEGPLEKMSVDATLRRDRCSRDELAACFLARQFRDGDRVGIASNVPVIVYAALLAHRLFGANIRLLISQSVQNFTGRVLPRVFHDVVDFRGSYGAEAYTRHYENLEGLPGRINVFIGGALQVDSYGSSNLIGLRNDDGGLRFRGPGALATTTMCDRVERWALFLTRHDPRVFVERCDFVSCVGYGAGGPEGRRAVGLSGSGPSFVLSPLGVFDFPEPHRRMRLRYLQWGVSVGLVVDATGFDLVIEDPKPIPPPSDDELDTLRGEVDVDGVLRKRPEGGLKR